MSEDASFICSQCDTKNGSLASNAVTCGDKNNKKNIFESEKTTNLIYIKQKFVILTYLIYTPAFLKII